MNIIMSNLKNTDISSPTNTEQVLKFSEERQMKIWQALGDLDVEFGPRLASMYEGITLSLQGNNPEKISIVCHLARELSSILPRYIPGIPVRQNRLSNEQIAKELNGIVAVLDSSGDKSGDSARIREIVQTLSTHFQAQPTQRDQIKAIIDGHPSLSTRPGYLNEEFIKQWMKVHEYFVKNSHHHELKNKNTSPSSDVELNANWSTLEGLLHRVLVKEPFFNAIQEIDRILAIQQPNEGNADELVRLIVEPEHRRYFFDKCGNSDWLELLNKRGAFSTPQEPIRRNGYIQFIGWPESQYLARVAAEKPQEVYGIIQKVNSDNQSVMDDFVDAAIKSPPKIASLYVKLIKDKGWLRGMYNLRLPDKIASLMEKLAVEGEADSALVLADEIFTLRIIEPTRTSDDESDPFPTIHPDAKPYFDEWQFAEIAKKKTISLATNKPVELFQVYVNKLHNALELEKRGNPPDGSLYEYSHIWRPNLAHARNHHDDAKNILLDALMGLVLQYNHDVQKLMQFITVLQKHPQALFKRVEMFILNFHVEDFIKEAEAILKDKQVILAYNLRREYLPLLGSAFAKVSKEAQQQILETISTGPDIHKSEDQTQEHFDHICADWRGLYFAPIKEHLPDPYKQTYNKIVEHYGESQDDDGEIKTWDGGKSPITSDKMASLGSGEAIEYLGSYTELDDPFSSFSSGGLGMIFAGVVTENPEKYVADANLLLEKKVRPLYIYHFFNGLKEALKKSKCFDWNSVIDLCYQIINLDVSTLVEPVNQREQDWHSVRRSIADLLGEALGTKRCEIPVELREKVWAIISNLAEDEEPTPEDEKRDGGGNLDPMTLAINTVRGESMHAVINYGLWLSRNHNESAGKETNKMPPELEKLLDTHLDTSKDPSLAIRSVYGWRLPNLFYLNRDWVISNKDIIFPEEETAQGFLMAALEGYVSNNIYFDLFDGIKSIYWRAISLLGKQSKTGYKAADIDERLPQQIMIVYIHDPKHDDLVEYFFATAPAKERGQAINFIGRVVLRELVAYPDKEAVVSRVSQLWDRRVATATDKNIDTEELREFGWWFKQSPFSHKETIDKLLKTLQVTNGLVDVPYEIVEELQNYATELPLEAITVLDLIARAEREYNELSYKKEEYKSVIRQVKSSENADAIKIADELINFIGSRGFIEFRDLLNP